MIKKFFRIFFIFLTVMAPVLSPPALLWAKMDAGNFDKVDEGLYRGGTPSDSDLLELKRMGVKTIVNFRTYTVKTEKEKVEPLGLRYVSLPVSGRENFDEYDAAAKQFLKAATDPSERPVYAHCNYGIYRTGIMIAVYRMEKYDWTLTAALDEMRKYGFREKANPSLVKFLSRYSRRKMAEKRGQVMKKF